MSLNHDAAYDHMRGTVSDYDAANQLLRLAAKYGMAQSPLSAQAAEMLDRLAAFSDAVNSHA